MKLLKHIVLFCIVISSTIGLSIFAKIEPLDQGSQYKEDEYVAPYTQTTQVAKTTTRYTNTSDVDYLEINIQLAGGGTGIAQHATPNLNIFITNRSKGVITKDRVDAGTIYCNWEENGINLYTSNTISGFVINPGTQIKKSISLNKIVAEATGPKTILCGFKPISGEGFQTNNQSALEITVDTASRFDLAINRAIDPIRENLDAPSIKNGKEGVVDFLMTKVIDILIPLVILVSILTAILGFYKLFFATDDKGISTGTKLLAFGAIGIVLMMSAKFFANVVYTDIFMTGDIRYGQLQGFEIAQKLYETLLFPFLKIAIYLSLGVLFVMLVSRVIGFVFGDDDAKKKAGTIITRNVIGMLLIIGSKSLVEFVYGKQADVVKSVSNLGEIGSGILSNRNYPFLYEVINRAMGLASLVILIMVLWQAFQLLMKPDAPDAMKKIKNSLLYIFIGIVIIGAGYIITNFLIIN